MDEAVSGLGVVQPFKLASACGTPKYTNFTVGYADCLDYIYYDTTKLFVSQVVPLPSTEELSQHSAIPSVVFPSDHVSLVADLKIKEWRVCVTISKLLIQQVWRLWDEDDWEKNYGKIY